MTGGLGPAPIIGVMEDNKQNSSPGLICIKVFKSQLEAGLARGLLETNGIESVVSTDSAGGMRPDLELIRGVRLLVRRENAQEALDVLEPG